MPTQWGLNVNLVLHWVISSIPLDAATIVLSSTGGAAEYQGHRLGEYVEAGEYDGRPYYQQRNTEGQRGEFLYSQAEEWKVSGILGNSACGLRNSANTSKPPINQWRFFNYENWTNDDLSLEFTNISPCPLVHVAGSGEVVEIGQPGLGSYR